MSLTTPVQKSALTTLRSLNVAESPILLVLTPTPTTHLSFSRHYSRMISIPLLFCIRHPHGSHLTVMAKALAVPPIVLTSVALPSNSLSTTSSTVSITPTAPSHGHLRSPAIPPSFTRPIILINRSYPRTLLCNQFLNRSIPRRALDMWISTDFRIATTGARPDNYVRFPVCFLQHQNFVKPHFIPFALTCFH